MGIGIMLLIYKFLDKDSLIGVIERSLPYREAGVLKGMVWGDKSGFDKDFYNKLKDSGLVHLMVASGTNVTLLASGGIGMLAGWWNRRWVIVMVLVCLWAYAGIVGWEPPMIRALLLISIFYWGQLLGRKYDLIRSLGVTVAIMVVIDPGMIVSVSFWLSLAAFVGVVTADFARQNMRIGKGVTLLWQASWSTIWISLWVTPILGLVFGRISLVAPISNVAVFWLVETICLVGGLGSVLGVLIPMLGRVILMGIYPLVGYLVWVVEGFGGWKWAAIDFEFNWLMLIGWYLVLGYWLIAGNAYMRSVQSGDMGSVRGNNFAGNRHACSLGGNAYMRSVQFGDMRSVRNKKNEN